MTGPRATREPPTTALAHLVREGATLCVAEVDAEERVVHANAALTKACGGNLEGARLDAVLTSTSHAALREHVQKGAERALLLQFTPPGAEPFSLQAFVEPRSQGFALAGEPPWDDHRALEARLQALNGELAELSREHARKARLLERALAELQDSHWHLKKVAEVLPMCVECRAVQTQPGTWEDVADFLTRSADFLSHGYCARCAAALNSRPPEGKERS